MRNFSSSDQQGAAELYLGVVGPLQLLLVDANLVLVLRPQLRQSFSQFAFKLLLPPAVDLHYLGTVPTSGLTQLLQDAWQDAD